MSFRAERRQWFLKLRWKSLEFVSKIAKFLLFHIAPVRVMQGLRSLNAIAKVLGVRGPLVMHPNLSK